VGELRTILHVDMDAFYASVEQRDHPEWTGSPVIVGADPAHGQGRGVVAACSYEARAYGVRSALPIGKAWRLCPKGVFVRPRMGRYAEVSRQVFDILRTYTDEVEPLSIDEAFLDVTGSRLLFGDGATIGRSIKARIRRELGLVASVGVAPNKFLSKMASEIGKPDGFVVVECGREREFLAPMPISRLWGVGPKTEECLRRMGLRTIGDIAGLRAEDLEASLGDHGRHLVRLSRGEDDRPVEAESEARSVGAENTFDEDTADPQVIRRTLLKLAERVATRLRGESLVAGGVTLKFRDEHFRTVTRSATLDEGTDLAEDVYRIALRLLDRVPWGGRKVRLLGVAATRLSPAAGGARTQLDLFGQAGSGPPKRLRHVARAVDEIREQFGHASITRAALLPESKPGK
jgi:DNA polymerase-4